MGLLNQLLGHQPMVNSTKTGVIQGQSPTCSSLQIG